MPRPPDDPEPQGRLVSEYDRFAMLPEWVLDADLSDRAVRLFAVLLRYANSGGTAFPSRPTLARRLRCSTDSVDRAIAELVAFGALHVRRQGGTAGEPFRANVYTLLRPTPQPVHNPGDNTPPSRTGAATPSRTRAASLAARVRNEREPKEREPKERERTLDPSLRTPADERALRAARQAERGGVGKPAPETFRAARAELLTRRKRRA